MSINHSTAAAWRRLVRRFAVALCAVAGQLALVDVRVADARPGDPRSAERSAPKVPDTSA